MLGMIGGVCVAEPIEGVFLLVDNVEVGSIGGL